MEASKYVGQKHKYFIHYNSFTFFSYSILLFNAQDYTISNEKTETRSYIKKEKRMKKYLFLLVLPSFGATKMVACPMTIKNDGTSQIVIVDPNGTQAIRLQPGSSQIIDPAITSFPQKYLKWLGYKEILNFYVENKDKPNTFYLKYQMTEHYCAESETFTLSDIIKFIDNPTDRFSVKQFEKKRGA